MINWIALAVNFPMSTHVSRFQSFYRFCIILHWPFKPTAASGLIGLVELEESGLCCNINKVRSCRPGFADDLAAVTALKEMTDSEY